MVGPYQLGSFVGTAMLALAHAVVAAPLYYLPPPLAAVRPPSLDAPIDTTISLLFQTADAPTRAFARRAGGDRPVASGHTPALTRRDPDQQSSILGIMIPTALVFLIIVVIIYVCVTKRRRQRLQTRDSRDLDMDDMLLEDIPGVDSRERRGRRGLRRDPLSRTSSGNTLRTLPQYTKDAGDEEVVLLRRDPSRESRPGSMSHWRPAEDDDDDIDHRNRNSDRVSLDITDHRRSASWGQAPPFTQDADYPPAEPPLPPDLLSEEGALAARAAIATIVTDGNTLKPPLMLHDHGSTSKLDTSSTYHTAPPSPSSTVTGPFISVLSSPSNTTLNALPTGSRWASPESMSSRSLSPAPLAPAQTVETTDSTPVAPTPLFPSPTPYVPTRPLSPSDQPSRSPPPQARATGTATTSLGLSIPPPPPPDIVSPDGFASPDAPWRLSMPAALVTARHAVMAQAVTLSPRTPVPTLPPTPPVPTLLPLPAQAPTPTLPPGAEPPIPPPAQASSSPSSSRPETPAPPYVAKTRASQPPIEDQPATPPSPEPEPSPQRKRWSRRMGRRISRLYGND